MALVTRIKDPRGMLAELEAKDRWHGYSSPAVAAMFHHYNNAEGVVTLDVDALFSEWVDYIGDDYTDLVVEKPSILFREVYKLSNGNVLVQHLRDADKPDGYPY